MHCRSGIHGDDGELLYLVMILLFYIYFQSAGQQRRICRALQGSIYRIGLRECAFGCFRRLSRQT